MDPQDSRRLTLPPGGVPVFASLFCVLQLIAVLNSLSIGFLLKRYRLAASGGIGFTRLDGWNRAALAADARMTNGQLSTTVIASWAPTALISNKCVAANLRFCPACLDGDFHTPAFQLLFLERCPVHGEPLTEQCALCGTYRPYSMSAMRRDCFGCDCKSERWNLIDTTDNRRRWIDGMAATLLDYLSWLAGIRSTFALASRERPRHGRKSLSRTLTESLGSPLSRLITDSKALGASFGKPTLIEAYPAATSFCVREQHDDDAKAIVVEGRGAGGRSLQQSILIAQHARGLVLCGAFGRPLDVPANFRARHAALVAVDHIDAFIGHGLDLIRMSASRGHATCQKLNHSPNPKMTARFGIDVCTVITAIRALNGRWTPEFRLSKRQDLAELVSQAVTVEQRSPTEGLIDMLAAELVCHRFILDVIHVARVICAADAHQQLQGLLADPRKWPCDLHFSIAVVINERLELEAHCAVIDPGSWQTIWAEACHVSENH